MNIKTIIESMYSTAYISFFLGCLYYIAQPALETPISTYRYLLILLSLCIYACAYGLELFSKKIHQRLHEAVKNNDWENVIYYLRYQPDINTRCPNNVPECENNKEDARTKCSCGGGSILIHAARLGHEGIVRLLLEKNANVHAVDNFNDTALAWAGFNGHKAIVETLLDAGSCVNTANRNGDTVLIETVRRGHCEIAQILIAHNAQINVANDIGNTPLMFAIQAGRVDTIRLLLSAKADCDVYNYYGETPLVFAVRNGMIETVRLLIEYGAYVNYASVVDGTTALLEAARIGNLEILKLLLRYKADINARYRNGQTALMGACKQGNETLVHYLLDNGADTEVKDKNGKTANDFCVNDTIKALIFQKKYS